MRGFFVSKKICSLLSGSIGEARRKEGIEIFGMSTVHLDEIGMIASLWHGLSNQKYGIPRG